MSQYKKGNTLKRFYNSLHNDLFIGTLSLIILSSVDLIGLNAFFLSIAVDWLTRAQFFALSIVAVFFKVIARTKRQNIAWFFWMIITFFGGFMFIINTVVIQGDDTKPEYVLMAESDYATAQSNLTGLIVQQSDYRTKNQRTLAASMDASIADARAAVTDARNAATVAETQWKAEPKHAIKALDIFARIPYIVSRPSWALTIAALFFVILYASIEASIFSIAGEIGKPKEIKPVTVKRDIVNLENLMAYTAAGTENSVPVKRAAPIVNPFTREDMAVISDMMEADKPDPFDTFDDVTDDDYRRAAEYSDGSVRLPEEVAALLRISRNEAEQYHAKLYAGYIYRDEKYVKIKG